MKESTTYQAILAEGEAKGEAKGEARGRMNEARSLILRQATRRFGAPSAENVSSLNSINDLERLELLGDRVLFVSNWDELLAP